MPLEKKVLFGPSLVNLSTNKLSRDTKYCKSDFVNPGRKFCGYSLERRVILKRLISQSIGERKRVYVLCGYMHTHTTANIAERLFHVGSFEHKQINKRRKTQTKSSQCQNEGAFIRAPLPYCALLMIYSSKIKSDNYHRVF